jgi:hypothetical protein
MPPPYSDPSDFARLVEELTARSVADQANVTRRYRAMLDRVAAGELDPIRMRVEYDRLVNEQGQRFAQDLTALGVNYYRAILDLNRAYVERLLDHLDDGPDVSPGGEHSRQPEPTPCETVELVGRPGETVTTSFVVENPEPLPARVTFFLSDVISEHDEVIRGCVEIDPPVLDLDGRDERRVTLRVMLDPERFAAGRRYRTQVLVRGIREFELQLEIAVSD